MSRGIVLRRAIVTLVLSAILPLLGAVTPAHATVLWMKVCNSDYSSTSLWAWNDETVWSAVIRPGECYVSDNAAGRLRIDPDNETAFPYQPDCNRWRMGEIGVGYGGWVDSDPDVIINPPNTWEGIRVHTD